MQLNSDNVIRMECSFMIKEKKKERSRDDI